MREPDFLVFLPVRNGGNYVALAIESVLAQTCANWRLIILENASTDGTAELLQRYRSDRVMVLPAPTGLSMHANWHRAWSFLDDIGAQDELVTFLGHDDLLYPDFLTDITGLTKAAPSATIYQTMLDLIDRNGAIIRPGRPMPKQEDWQDTLAALCWGTRDSFGTGYAFRACDYRAIGGIPNLPMLLYSDHLLVTRAAARGAKVASRNINVGYRQHRGSVSGALSMEKFNAEAEALAVFAAVIQAEFATFLLTDHGRAAFAALLARGTFALRTPAVYRRLTPANRAHVDALVALFEHYARGVPASAMVGPPAYNSRLVTWLRRANQTAAVWKQLLPDA